MDRAQNQVRQFMLKGGQSFPTSPLEPSIQTRILRIKLLLEEVLELAAASGLEVFAKGVSLHDAARNNALSYMPDGETDLVEVADAIADIQYVNLGASVAFGIDIELIFEEVHSSNMTKWWKKEELGQVPKDATVTDLFDGTYCVKNSAGKILKSPSYRPANLGPLILAQLHQDVSDWR